jgi:hypothetical protein
MGTALRVVIGFFTGAATEPAVGTDVLVTTPFCLMTVFSMPPGARRSGVTVAQVAPVATTAVAVEEVTVCAAASVFLAVM